MVSRLEPIFAGRPSMKMRIVALLALAIGLAPGTGFAFEGAVREVPARAVPVPADTVSPGVAALIAAPLPPFWNDHPQDAAAWKALIKKRADAIVATLPDLRAKLEVKVAPG